MFGLWNSGENLSIKRDAKTKKDLEDTLRMAFVDRKWKLVSIEWLCDRNQYSKEVIKLGIEEGYLKFDSFTDSDTKWATTIYNYKLTEKGKKYFGLK